METRLNPNQISGSVGGGSLVGELYIDNLRTGDGDVTKWIELFPDSPGTAKCNDNAEYIVEVRAPFGDVFGAIMTIGDVVTLWYSPNDGFRSDNLQTGDHDTVMSPSTDIPDVPYAGQYEDGQTLRLRCRINGTTKAWDYDVNGLWTALTHDENGVAAPSSFTDTGINTASTKSNMLLNNGFYDAACSCDFNFTAFRIISNGQTVFDGRTAARGLDYETYRRNNGSTVQAAIKLTHYL